MWRTFKGKGKVNHWTILHQESICGCSSPSSRPWARRWTTNVCDGRVASATPDLRLLSQPQGITARRLVPNYTARWHRHTCVNNLPRVAFNSGEAGIRTHDLLIASPAPYRYATRRTLLLLQFSNELVNLNLAKITAWLEIQGSWNEKWKGIFYRGQGFLLLILLKVTTRPGFYRTVLYFLDSTLSWIWYFLTFHWKICLVVTIKQPFHT